MRILFLLDHFRDDNPTNSIFYRLCQRWSVNRQLMLHAVAFAEDGPLRHQLEALGMVTRIVPWEGLRSLGRFRRQARRITGANDAPDLLHSFCSWPDFAARFFARANPALPLLTSLNSMDLCCTGQVQESMGRRALERLTRRPNQTITVCCGLLLQELANRKVPDSKVQRIPMGVDGVQCYPISEKSKARFRSLLGVDADVPLLISAGRLDEDGDHDVLIRAMKRVHQEHPSARLFIIGDGPQRQRLEALAQELSLRGHVRLVGQLSAVLGKLYSTADLVVHPVRHEAFSLPVAEAQAAGTPVIAADCSGTPELVRDGETALLFKRGDADDLADKICLLLAEEELREAMGAAAREHVLENFELGETARAYMELWRSLAPDAAWSNTASIDLDELEDFKREVEQGSA